MTLADLEQALFTAKYSDAEEDATEVIARLLDLPRTAVERVLYAAAVVRQSKLHKVREYMDEGNELSHELRGAITIAVNDGLRRAAVRWSIQNDRPLYVNAKKLVGKNASVLCGTCPFSIDCAVRDISTPAQCLRDGPPAEIRQRPNGKFDLLVPSGGCTVKLDKMRGDQVWVTCEHPRGEWVLNIADFNL